MHAAQTRSHLYDRLGCAQIAIRRLQTQARHRTGTKTDTCCARLAIIGWLSGNSDSLLHALLAALSTWLSARVGTNFIKAAQIQFAMHCRVRQLKWLGTHVFRNK